MDKDKKLTGWDRLEEGSFKQQKQLKNGAFPTYVRKSKPENKNWQEVLKERFPRFKKVIFASFSAIIIGTVLGMTMLHLLTNLNENGAANAHQQRDIQQVIGNDEDENQSVGTKETVVVPEMKGMVLQAGVFQNQANAEELLTTLKQLGFPTLLWPQDRQYLLFAGISPTREGLGSLAEKLEENDIETYVKEWVVSSFEIELTEADFSWVKDVQAQWKDALESGDGEPELDTASWKKLVDRSLDENSLSGLQALIQEEISDHEGQVSTYGAQDFLLETWQEIANLKNE